MNSSECGGPLEGVCMLCNLVACLNYWLGIFDFLYFDIESPGQDFSYVFISFIFLG